MFHIFLIVHVGVLVDDLQMAGFKFHPSDIFIPVFMAQRRQYLVSFVHCFGIFGMYMYQAPSVH